MGLAPWRAAAATLRGLRRGSTGPSRQLLPREVADCPLALPVPPQAVAHPERADLADDLRVSPFRRTVEHHPHREANRQAREKAEAVDEKGHWDLARHAGRQAAFP